MSQCIILHLGAHRTGTTSLQAALKGAAHTLREAGVVALTPPGAGRRADGSLRDLVRAATRQSPGAQLSRIFGAQARSRGRLQRLIFDKAQGIEPERIIISDETLLGTAFKRDGRAFYVNAETRLRSFREVCPGPVDEVHLTIRSYDSFLVSVYAMRAVYAGGLADFDALRPALTLFQRGWPELVATIHEVFPNARLKLSELEKTDQRDRLTALTAGIEIDAPSASGKRINAAPTREAIDHALTKTPGSYDPDAVVARFANGTAFHPLSEDEVRALQVRYAEDLIRLQARADADFVLGSG